jgi:hypothetical protein
MIKWSFLKNGVFSKYLKKNMLLNELIHSSQNKIQQKILIYNINKTFFKKTRVLLKKDYYSNFFLLFEKFLELVKIQLLMILKKHILN